MRAAARGKPAKVGLTRVIVADEVARQSACLADQRNKVARGNRPAYSSYRENRIEVSDVQYNIYIYISDT